MKKLFNDFPKISKQEWEDIINKDLKGASYEKKLVWKTIEGLSFNPYYTAEDLKNLDFLNNLKEGKFQSNNWLVVQDIIVKRASEANLKAIKLLSKGVDVINFVFPKDSERNRNEKAISKLINGIDLEKTQINFTAEDDVESLVYMLGDILNEQIKDVKGAISFDPIGNYAFTGKLEETALFFPFNFSKHAVNYEIVKINATKFANAGASTVQQLAIAISIATEYVDFATENSFKIDNIAKNISFEYGIGSSYFIEIAKFRAARHLWNKIIEAYKPTNSDSTKTKIHAVTSRSNKTIYDPHVNMLRTTTEAMSAIIGGVDSLKIEPFDAVFSEPTEFSERIARNQQIILKEEAYLDKVIDISAGSYYVENLTSSLIEAAWKLFLEIEENGGFTKATQKGFISKIIKETTQKRDLLIATGRQTILGTNQYPNQEEKNNTTKTTSNIRQTSGEFELLKNYRGAEAFENLRQTTEKNDKQPKVFMLTYGNQVMRKARADFSENFFAIAGFEIINNIGFETIEQGINESINQNADIIVLCSSDDSYLEMAEAIKKSNLNKIIVVAGYPKNIDEIKQLGIENFIHAKSNILEELSKFQTKTLLIK